MDVDSLHVSDPAVIARYLQVRTVLHDRHLARVEQFIVERYLVQPTRRAHPTLVTDLRTGFVRAGEGELWPVVFLTAVDLSLGLCVQMSADRVAGLGTTVNGPQRIRHRGWEDWWGWERQLGQLQPGFFDLPGARQEEVAAAWYTEGLEWLANAGLMRRKT